MANCLPCGVNARLPFEDGIVQMKVGDLININLSVFKKHAVDWMTPDEPASVREIIEATGVTRPVLYYYCSNKEDLFKRLVHWKHDEAYRELGRIARETKGTANRLRAIIRGSFAFCAVDPRVPRVMFQAHFGPASPCILLHHVVMAAQWLC